MLLWYCTVFVTEKWARCGSLSLPKIMSHPHMLACFSGSSASALLGIQSVIYTVALS